jgi:hypothetical protein
MFVIKTEYKMMTNIVLKKIGMFEKGPAQEIHKSPPLIGEGRRLSKEEECF